MTELEKCKTDFAYWFEKYCVIKDKNTGQKTTIKLKDYQINFVNWLKSWKKRKN